MNIFKKRPLLIALFVFTFCSCLSAVLLSRIRILLTNVSFCLFVISVILCLILLLFKNKRKGVFITIALCLTFAFIAFLSSYSFLDKKLPSIEALETEEVIAIIDECTFSSLYMTTYTAQIVEINGVKTNFKASISSEPPVYLENGDTFSATMSFSPFTTTNTGYDSRRSNISDGIFVSATFESVELIENNRFSIVKEFNELRSKIEQVVDRDFDSGAPLIKALLIGKTNDIDARTRNNFSRLGISHILSISGTHFTVLLGMVAILLSSFGMNKRIVYALLIPIASFYVGLSGFSFSVCRAGIMALLSYFGFLCGKLRDSYTALFIALTVILLISPYAIFSISLWLSFTATFTIITIIDLLSGFLGTKEDSLLKKLFKYIVLRLLISVAVIFTTLPIISIYFGYVSVIAPIANLLIVPLFELFLYIAPFSVMFSKNAFVADLTNILSENLLLFAKEIASIDGLLIPINQNFVKYISIVGIAVTLLFIAIPLKKKFVIALPSILTIISIIVALFFFYDARFTETRVTYYNIGVSDGMVVSDSNQTACIDISSGASASVYYSQAIIKEHYSAKISSYVFTHYRKNHINSFEKLASRMYIEKVFLPIVTAEKDLEYMSSLIEIANEFKIEVITYNYGEHLTLGSSEIIVLEPQYIKRSSHEIISVFISTDEDDLLYLGSSFSDSTFDFSYYISEAEYVVFGRHYPKANNEFEISTNANLIYGSDNIFKLSKITKNGLTLNNGDRYNILLK